MLNHSLKCVCPCETVVRRVSGIVQLYLESLDRCEVGDSNCRDLELTWLCAERTLSGTAIFALLKVRKEWRTGRHKVVLRRAGSENYWSFESLRENLKL